LPKHLVANFYFGIDLLRKERHSVSLQFNIENATNRIFRVAKESEFTPMQFSPPRDLCLARLGSASQSGRAVGVNDFETLAIGV
jgi:hypothetical protein